ncbi:S46 family peptidase [Bacteroidota bacterium]
MKKVLQGFLVLMIIIISNVKADEGMWIPLLIEKFNIEDMQAKGFKLTAEDIYSINQACIKDAIVIFGRGCTGELVSNQGLLLTNHHCGYGAIQRHSSVENDYLTDGFWAMNQEEELPNPGLSVTFLERIEDVTDKVLDGVKEKFTENERNEIISTNIERIKTEAIGETKLFASVRPFYYGNQYFLFIYKEYNDVRLVGAPPSAIGKFGGDTDNWVWPRHTGDFSIFRIYADKDNNPAEYSPENVPYIPKKYLPISIKGIDEGDFTWVLGYPGGTARYITSDAIKLIKDVRNPQRVVIRDKRLEIMNAYMEKNDTIRIKYASKNAGVSNSWKRWKGEIIGLERLDAIDKKIELEKTFNEWAEKKKKYKDVLPELENIYYNIEEFVIAYDNYREAIRAIEIVGFASRFDRLIKMSEEENNDESWNYEIDKLEKETERFFKDYSVAIDKEIFTELLPLYFSNVDIKYHPEIKEEIKDYNTYIESLYNSTVFVSKDKILEIMQGKSKAEVANLVNDPVYKFYTSFNQLYREKIYPVYDSLNQRTSELYRIYMKGLMEMQKEKVFFPDANFTMRISYGEVKGSYPRDGVKYKYYTTLDGVIEKDNPNIYDYDVPEKLKELYQSKDFGDYNVNGTVPVCFIATNHTTGGNSGSPVLDAEGNLIGLNFDRMWEGIMSDMIFDPNHSRNISLDIRYVLFIVEKFAGAEHLIDEMTIIK